AKNLKVSDFEKMVSAPQAISDPFADYVAYLRQSNKLVTRLYSLDKDHAFENQGTPAGKDFVVRRLAAASKKLVDLWYTAWLESAKDVPPYVPPKPANSPSPSSSTVVVPGVSPVTLSTELRTAGN